MTAFQVLGPEAAGAADDLARLVQAPDAATTAARAARALAHLGEKAFPTLLTALTNAPTKARADVAAEIGTFLHYGGSYGTKTALAASGLTQCLKEQDTRLASFAVMALSEMTNAPNLVVPALTDCLRDSRRVVQSSAAFGLEKFGENARPAVPALVSLLRSPDRGVRVFATQTLRRIDPHALTNAPPLDRPSAPRHSAASLRCSVRDSPCARCPKTSMSILSIVPMSVRLHLCHPRFSVSVRSP